MSSTQKAPDIRAIAERINTRKQPSYPLHDTMSLNYHGRAMKTTVMCDAWKKAGRDPENPGTALQLYFPEEEVLLIDLS